MAGILGCLLFLAYLSSAELLPVTLRYCSVVSLSHVLGPRPSVFPGDPPFNITVWNTIPRNGYKLEFVHTGTHTGTHMSAPCHFVEGKKCIDELPAATFVKPLVVMDVRARVARNPLKANFTVEWKDIRAFESAHETIRPNSMVVLFTGFDSLFGTSGYTLPSPGFSKDCIDRLFSSRMIGGVGTDTFGPDVSTNKAFPASLATYQHGGVTLENLSNLAQAPPVGSTIVFTPAKLYQGSGYQCNPLALIPCTQQ